MKVAHKIFITFVFACLVLVSGQTAFASANGGTGDLTGSVGIAIVAAMVMGYLSHVFKQPLLLAYLIAGIVIGPKMGLGLITSEQDVETLSHIGLVLLLFLIGLEIDIKKLKDSGKSLIATGVTQFPIGAAMGIGFFSLLGYTFGNGRYDLFYLAVCTALSSTTIVVKLLNGKYELDTLAGRITLGVLVFQDVWAIIMLGIQPNLADPAVTSILFSFVKGAALVAVSMLASRYVLPRLFRSMAKTPELMLISSLGWCALVCGAAGMSGLSLEMGALIAGVSISTFPYNLDVIAKVINIRDFFVTLFFVALGMQVPNPFADPELLVQAVIVSLFIAVSRFLSVYPVLYALGNGNRISLISSINLAQISEFSLVIAALGVAAGHIDRQILTVIVFAFVITSVCSTYMIKYSNEIQKAITPLLRRIGLKGITSLREQNEADESREIAILGFHRVASSLVHDILAAAPNGDGAARRSLKDKIVVVDFNPETHANLNAKGIKVVYGDISHMDTLHHAGIHNVKVVLSTIPDTILVGTDNLRMIRHIRSLCPEAKIIVTAESAGRALKMYAEGADYVFLPRLFSAEHVAGIVEHMLSKDESRIDAIRNEQIAGLELRREIVN